MMKEKLANLEGWRGLLSLVVCVSHSFQLLAPQYLWKYSWMRIWGTLSHFSVLAFFFISGIVIFHSLKIRFNNNESSFSHYFRSRFLRIYPPLIGAIIVLFILRFLVFSFNIQSIKPYFDFSNFDLVNGLLMIKLSLGNVNAPLWSLALEWWFYFIGYILLFGVKTKNYLIKIILLFSLALTYSFLLNINTNLYLFLLVWLMGGGYYILINYFYQKKIFVYVCILLGMYLIFWENILFQQEDFNHQTLNQIISVIAFSGLWNYLPKINFLLFLSRSSYSLYIIHYPLLLFILGISRMLNLDLHVVLILSIILIIGISHMYARVFENKKYFEKIIFRQSSN